MYRMSMAGNQQNQNRGRKKEDDNDALMRLVSVPETRDPGSLKLDANIVTAGQRDRRMYQRHWDTVYRRRPGEAESSTDSNGVRVVRRAPYEHYARDC